MTTKVGNKKNDEKKGSGKLNGGSAIDKPKALPKREREMLEQAFLSSTGLLRRDPAKVEKYAKQSRLDFEKARDAQYAKKQQYLEWNPPARVNPGRSGPSSKANLQKRRNKRRKPVVKNDWGLSKREDRLMRRISELERRLSKRKNGRRGPQQGKPENVTDTWIQDTDAVDWGPPQEKNESWWGPIVDTAANVLPHLIPLVAGLGDYEAEDISNQTIPKMNSLAAAASDGEMCNEVPFMHSNKQTTRLIHREYIGDVYSATGGFQAMSIPLNPGLEQFLPWGSSTANNFTNYTLDGCIFEFISEASEYVNQIGMGYVALGTQYNPIEPAWGSKREMLNSEFSVARKPSESFAHYVECDPSILALHEQFIRNGNIPANADLRMYDHGRTVLSVGGNSVAGAIIGELWVSYDMHLILPIDTAVRNPNGVCCTIISGVGQPAASTPLGTSWSTRVAGIYDTFTPTVTSTTITLPAGVQGTFLACISWAYTANAGSGFWPGITATNGADMKSLNFQGPSGNIQATGTSMTGTLIFQSQVDFGQLTFDNTGGYGTSSTFSALIVQIPDATLGLGNLLSDFFDPQGKNRDERYGKFMGKFLAQGEETNGLVRSTKAFEMLKDVDGYAVKASGGNWRCYPVEPMMAVRLNSCDTDEFDKFCFSYIREKNGVATWTKG